MATRFGNLSFQARLTLVAAVAVALAIIGPGLLIYHLVEGALISQIDDNLRERAASAHLISVHPSDVPGSGTVYRVTLSPVVFGGPGGYAQLVTPDGPALPEGQTPLLPVTSRDQQVAEGKAQPYARDETVNGRHLRVLTTRLADQAGFALQITRPLDEVDNILSYLRLVLVALAVCAIPLAALLGRIVAHAALAPIHRLRAAVDHVTDTQDMKQRVPDEGQDELGRLGAHFNRMLGALDQSLLMQRQLVADASHELRTPLASLRTNIEVLQRRPDLPSPDRERLLKDVVSQIEQLTKLIQDLIDLARGDQAPEVQEEVRLDWIVGNALERAATNWPSVRFQPDLRELVVMGEPRRLDRAVSNLLDNAGKWSQPGQVVEVRVVDHELTVRDHGPGIAEEDLPHIFDRFWRAPAARGMPGSGLGLSIVRQVAETHRATVRAERPPGGGTLMRLQFPELPESPNGSPDS